MRPIDTTIDLHDVLRELPHAKAAGGVGDLITVGTNPKTVKSDKRGEYLTAIMHLSPGVWVCPGASKGCLKACLHTAGNPVYLQGKKAARRKRTNLFRQRPAVFLARLVLEIQRHVKRCEKAGVKPAVRLNGTSDIAWERVAPWLFELFPEVQFYDYTKRFERLGKTPRNYWLTFSRSEENDFLCGVALAKGHHISVVIDCKKHNPPKRWHGYRTNDGDADDLLFTRRHQVEVLAPKGKAKKDKSGFVILNNAA